MVSKATKPISARRNLLYSIVACLLGLVVAFALLELIFRLLLVREPLETRSVTAEDPYLNNDVLFSMGWNFEIVNKLHVNNYGFVNDQDYDPGATSPLLAVIGDRGTRQPSRQAAALLENHPRKA